MVPGRPQINSSWIELGAAQSGTAISFPSAFQNGKNLVYPTGAAGSGMRSANCIIGFHFGVEGGQTRTDRHRLERFYRGV